MSRADRALQEHLDTPLDPELGVSADDDLASHGAASNADVCDSFVLFLNDMNASGAKGWLEHAPMLYLAKVIQNSVADLVTAIESIDRSTGCEVVVDERPPLFKGVIL